MHEQQHLVEQARFEQTRRELRPAHADRAVGLRADAGERLDRGVGGRGMISYTTRPWIISARSRARSLKIRWTRSPMRIQSPPPFSPAAPSMKRSSEVFI
ncbi:MAG: hypothetical protein Q8S73_11925 [Deltaproteobacteria bacterium]|nr:hypothetical protein [Myxococcales bacterium]MDP3214806.1 hypothetical protein [Deltaproteobacteria bacterium]